MVALHAGRPVFVTLSCADPSLPVPCLPLAKVANALARQGTSLPIVNTIPTYKPIEQTRTAGKAMGATSRRMPCRILVVSGGSEPPSQYVTGMNCIFAAQKLVRGVCRAMG